MADESLIYLDYAATTPVDPAVLEAMLPWLDNSAGFANPSSDTHSAGRAAAAAVQFAAEQVAGLINALPDELVWTSGATEADNLAIIGAARFRAMHGKHLITVSTEHKAVLEACAALEAEGYTVTYLPPDQDGRVDPEQVAAAIGSETTLVSVMHANNETGVIQDVVAIGNVCRERGVLFHVDAAQSLGKLPIDVQAMQIDLLSLNAHKACGPKGVGALYLNSSRAKRVAPLLHGGGQQRALRPGTLPVHQIVGMGETCRMLAATMADEVARLTTFRDRLSAGLLANEGVMLNGPADKRLCSIVNVSATGVEGESLRFALDKLAVSSGSACNSASGEPSYVLRALGRSDAEAEASIRFSLGRFTTEAEIDAAIAAYAAALAYLRDIAPVAGMAGAAA